MSAVVEDVEDVCWYCGGEGWAEEDDEDGIYERDIVPCPNCGGSGRAEDCTWW